MLGRYFEPDDDEELLSQLHEMRAGLQRGLSLDDLARMFPLGVNATKAAKRARDIRIRRQLKRAGYEPCKIGNNYRYFPVEQLSDLELMGIIERRLPLIVGTTRNLLSLLASYTNNAAPDGQLTKEQKDFLKLCLYLIQISLNQSLASVDAARKWLDNPE